MGVWTNAGRNLVATALQSSSNVCAVTYVAISTGCGTLASPLTIGNSYSSLTLDAGLPVTLAAGQSLTITDGTNSQVVTVGTTGATATSTTISVTTFTTTASFAAHTSGVCPTPAASDTALYHEGARVAATIGTAGAGVGESLNSGYFDGTQATGIYLLVGYFGGSTATSSTGTGTLLMADVQFWNHTLNADSNTYQADSTL